MVNDKAITKADTYAEEYAVACLTILKENIAKDGFKD